MEILKSKKTTETTSEVEEIEENLEIEFDKTEIEKHNNVTSF